MVNATPVPVGFELRLPPLALEGGGTVGGSAAAHVLRGVLWGPEAGFGLPRIRASLLVASIDSDQLYFPAQSQRLARALRAHGRFVEEVELRSDHGHDAFLIEWEQLDQVLRRGLALPAFGAPR